MTVKKSKSFHHVRPQELPLLRVDREFSEIKILVQGPRKDVYVARHVLSDSPVALKCVHKDITKKDDFFREVHYNYFLSPHPNIIKSYEEASQTKSAYVFSQELAPGGDLAGYLLNSGISELETKRVAEQISFALEFMQTKNLVHRAVHLENILVFKPNMQIVKLGNFSLTKVSGTLVKKCKKNQPWDPPEVCDAVYNEGYYVEASQDAWQLGILIYVCLVGSYPWYVADITDKDYSAWLAWLKRRTTKIPIKFKQFSPRLLRLFRRLLEPKPSRRADVGEVHKYRNDPWVDKGISSLVVSLYKSSSRVFVNMSRASVETDNSSKKSQPRHSIVSGQLKLGGLHRSISR